jgi:hypothetical protein
MLSESAAGETAMGRPSSTNAGRTWLAITLLLLLGLTARSAWAKEWRVEQVDPADGVLTVVGEGAITVSGGDAATAKLKTIAAGDTVSLPNVIVDHKIAAADVTVATREVGLVLGVAAVAAALVVVLVYVLVVTGGEPRTFILGADNRFSSSKVQMAAWFGVVAVAYGATFLLRLWLGGLDYLGGIDMPADLLTLIGLSGASGGGAKLSTGMKAAAAEQHNRQLAANPPANPDAQMMQPTKVRKSDPSGWGDLWHDLTHNDAGQWDVGDAQMLVVTAIAIVAFAVAVVHYWAAGIQLVADTTLPDVNLALTALFGGGLGAYLAKKIAGKLGEA